MDFLFWLLWLTLAWAALWDCRRQLIPHTVNFLILGYAVVWGFHWIPFLVMVPAGLLMWRIGLWEPGDCKLLTVLAAAAGWRILDLLLLSVVARDVYRGLYLWLRHGRPGWRELWHLMQTEYVPMAPLFTVLWILSPLGPAAALAVLY